MGLENIVTNLVRRTATREEREEAIARELAARKAAVVESPQAAAALELSQTILRGVEHFVISTPDLDTPGFLDRLRRVGADLDGMAEPEAIRSHSEWAAESLAAFGQLQRRYLSEREEELWRLMGVYQEQRKLDGVANLEFARSLRDVHQSLNRVVRLNDLRLVREKLESELERAARLIDDKERADEERSAGLNSRVAQLEAALSRARQESRMDPLTCIYHRGAFYAELRSMLEGPTPCSLAMVDVDNFKNINDTLGHLVGDDILRLAVQFLVKVARPGDVIARYGGDEFCLLAQNVPPRRLADRFAQMVGQRLINFKSNDHLYQVRLSFSVGIASAGPGQVPEDLIRRADRALYEAKGAGRACVRVSEEE